MIQIEHGQFSSPEEIREQAEHTLASLREAMTTANRSVERFIELANEIKAVEKEIEEAAFKLESATRSSADNSTYLEALENLCDLIETRHSLMESRLKLYSIFEEETAKAEALETELDTLKEKFIAASEPRPQA